MAVDRKQYTEKVDTGLKSTKDFKKFYISIKVDGKIRQKTLDYSDKEWDKRTRIAKAKSDLLELKTKEIESSLGFTEHSTLNSVSNIYFELVRNQSKWSIELKKMYELYIMPDLGRKKIKDIRKIHIDSLRKNMEIKGHSKQTENGCSPRTIKKILIQILKPILQYAVDNKVLAEIPIINVPKQNRKKKKVKNASETLAILYKTIMTLYKDNAFYRALFLFALYGRRLNEILTLDWKDINFKHTTYTIRAENNKVDEDQTFEIPTPLLEALSDINNDKVGLVFKSPVTGKKLYSPKKQLAKIKKLSGIEELTMHYFRHILVSAMGEMGTANTILSASLGHTNLDTVNDYYLSANHTKGSRVTNETIDKLLANN